MKSYIIHPESSSFGDFSNMPGFSLDNHTIEQEIDTNYLLCGILVKDDNDAIIGRAAFYKNPFHKIKREASISVGYFESIDDNSVSDLIFSRARDIAKLYRCDHIIGPMNGSTWRNYRYLSDGDVTPFFLEHSVPTYYYKLWKRHGFDTLAQYSSEKVLLDQSDREIDLEKHCQRIGVTLRHISLETFEDDIKKIGKLSLETFDGNFLYSPIVISQFMNLYSKSKGMIDPSKVILAEKGEKLVGFVFAIPNYLDKKEKGLIIKSLSRSNESKYRGLGSIIIGRLLQIAKQEDFKYLINAYIHSENDSLNTSKKFNGKSYKTYELLKMAV